MVVELYVEDNWDQDNGESYFFNVPSKYFDLLGAIRNLINDFLSSESPEMLTAWDALDLDLDNIDSLDFDTTMNVLYYIPHDMFDKYNFSVANTADFTITVKSTDKLFE